MMSFLARFGQAKGNQLGRNIVEAIVRFDPETASEAQIAEFEDHLDQLTQRVAVLRREYDKEKKEADAAEANYNRYLAAAEKLEGQLRDPALADKHAEIEKSLTGLLANLETLVPEVEREKEEATEAKAFLDQFEDAAKEAATKVTTARDQLKKARRDMESAAQRRVRAEARAEQTTVLAGIRQHSDSLGVALNAMNSAAQKDLDAAGAAEHKSVLLTQAMPKAIEDDPIVREAMGTVTASPAPASLSERLAALKGKK